MTFTKQHNETASHAIFLTRLSNSSRSRIELTHLNGSLTRELICNTGVLDYQEVFHLGPTSFHAACLEPVLRSVRLLS
jgi:hypothetical protein